MKKIQEIEYAINGELFTIGSFSLKKSTLTKKGSVYENIAVFRSR